MNLGEMKSTMIVMIGLLALSGCGKKEQADSDMQSSTTSSSNSDGAVVQASHTTDVSDSSSASHLPERQPTLIKAQGNAAVLDLNRVAIGLDRISGFESRLKVKHKELESQIQLLEDGYEEELEDLKRDSSEMDEQVLAALIAEKEQERDLNLAEARRQAAQKLLQFEEVVKREFMVEVRPIAFQVALDNGFGVVLTKPQVFAFQVGSQVDITDRVIAQMKATNPSQPNSSLPQLASPIPTETNR